MFNIAFKSFSLFIRRIESPSLISFKSFLSKSNSIGIVHGVSSANLFSDIIFSRSFLHKNPSNGEKTPLAIFIISSERLVFI